MGLLGARCARGGRARPRPARALEVGDLGPRDQAGAPGDAGVDPARRPDRPHDRDRGRARDGMVVEPARDAAPRRRRAPVDPARPLARRPAVGRTQGERSLASESPAPGCDRGRRCRGVRGGRGAGTCDRDARRRPSLDRLLRTWVVRSRLDARDAMAGRRATDGRPRGLAALRSVVGRRPNLDLRRARGLGDGSPPGHDRLHGRVVRDPGLVRGADRSAPGGRRGHAELRRRLRDGVRATVPGH